MTTTPTTRIYLVASKQVEFDDTPLTKRLVRAPNAAQALRHVASDFTVTVPSQDELLAAAADGIQVESAKTGE